MPGSDNDRKAPLVERLTGASAADVDPSTPSGASRQEELRQRLRKKTEKAGEEELLEKKEEEEPGKQDWDVVRGLQNAAMLLGKVRLVQPRACLTRRDQRHRVNLRPEQQRRLVSACYTSFLLLTTADVTSYALGCRMWTDEVVLRSARTVARLPRVPGWMLACAAGIFGGNPHGDGVPLTSTLMCRSTSRQRSACGLMKQKLRCYRSSLRLTKWTPMSSQPR